LRISIFLGAKELLGEKSKISDVTETVKTLNRRSVFAVTARVLNAVAYDLLGVERYGLRQRFWTELLERAKSKTELHSNISPSELNWIGVSAGMRGLGLNYVILQHEGRVELYIDRGVEDENKSIFDALVAERASVEAGFGEALQWQRLEGKAACRICKGIALGGYRDEERWPAIQDAMIDAMIRLGKVFEPYVVKLRSKG
jgi:hypothetical protein